MHRLLNYRRLVAVCLVLSSFLTLTVLTPSFVAAASLNDLADSTGATCALPDGSAGTIQNDGHTCCPSNDQGGNSNQDTDCLFYKYINPFIDLLSAAVGVVVVIAVIIGAIEFSTSGGDPQRAASGRRHITNALLGLVAYILLYVFLEFLVPGGSLHG